MGGRAGPPASALPPTTAPDWRNKQAGMKYRRLGRTGYMGNYFNGQLHEIETDALSDVLERRYHLRIEPQATDADTTIRSVEESLTRVKTDHVDIQPPRTARPRSAA